jgi:para-nitrobenzyl esterase
MTRAMRSAFTEHLPEAATTDDVLAAGRMAITAARRFGTIGGFPFAPIVGADPLPVNLDAALADVAPNVELFVGHTKHDASPFVAVDPRAAKLAKLGVAGRAIRPLLVRGVTQRLFGSAHVADIWRTAGGKVATYRLDWAPAGNGLGACHCLELPLLFNGDWSDAPMLAGQPPPPELTAEIRRTWATFARSGADALDFQQIRFR